MPAERFQVLRHRVRDGGRQRQAAHNKPLQRLLQSEARRNEGAGCKQQYVEASGR